MVSCSSSFEHEHLQIHRNVHRLVHVLERRVTFGSGFNLDADRTTRCECVVGGSDLTNGRLVLHVLDFVREDHLHIPADCFSSSVRFPSSPCNRFVSCEKSTCGEVIITVGRPL